MVNKIRAAREALESMRPAKMAAAFETLTRYLEALCVKFRHTRNHALGKRLLAGLAFEAWYLANRQQLRESGSYEPITCVAGIDRVVFTASDVAMDSIGAMPGYETMKPRALWLQAYRTATPIRGNGSIREVTVESDPSKPYSPRYRVVVVPHDKIGLRAKDLASILESLSNPKLQLVEVALDFPSDSVVDTEFVQRYGVFGKSNPHRVGQIPAYDSWGSRKGPKFVKSYYKPEISGHRVEPEFHAPDLQRYGITDVFQFPKLATLIPGHHVFFGRINHAALLQRLVSEEYPEDQVREIRRRVKSLEWNLCAALNYLRKDVGLKNVRRILIPLDDANLEVRKGVEKWLARWRADLAQLRREQP